MRKKGSKGRHGRKAKCPKCNYIQKVKTKLLMVCCSNCGNKSRRSKWHI